MFHFNLQAILFKPMPLLLWQLYCMCYTYSYFFFLFHVLFLLRFESVLWNASNVYVRLDIYVIFYAILLQHHDFGKHNRCVYVYDSVNIFLLFPFCVCECVHECNNWRALLQQISLLVYNWNEVAAARKRYIKSERNRQSEKKKIYGNTVWIEYRLFLTVARMNRSAFAQ